MLKNKDGVKAGGKPCKRDGHKPLTIELWKDKNYTGIIGSYEVCEVCGLYLGNMKFKNTNGLRR